MTQYLSTNDAVAIANRMGLGIRDLGLLASAIARPAASAFGKDAYPDLPTKIATLIEGINRNHPLVDGNKRLSWVCARMFARINGFELRTDPDDGETTILVIAGSRMDLDTLTEWVTNHLTRNL